MAVDGMKCEAEPFARIMESNQDIQVPVYQRRYSWKKENIASLWADLVGSFEEPADQRTIFLGSIVFHGVTGHDGKVVRHLVDGQQRITTLTLLLGQLRHRMLVFDSGDLGALVGKTNDVLFRLEAEQVGRLRPDADLRLHLSKKDENLFKSLMVRNSTKGPNTLLKRAWKALGEMIDETVEEGAARVLKKRGLSDPSAEEYRAAELQALKELGFNMDHAIRHAAVFSVVRVDPPFDPLTVFERLNSSGMPLAASDLIKNLLVQRVSKGNQDSYADQWDALADALQDDIVQFIRYWYIASHSHVTVRQLYNEMSRVLLTEHDVIATLEEWGELSEWYRSFRWGDPPPKGHGKLAAACQEYSLTGFRQGIAPLLALVKTGETKLVPRAIEAVSSIFIRVLRTAQIRGSVFEQRLEDACRRIRDDPLKGVENLESVARDLILKYTDGINWKSFHPSGIGLQRYVLGRLARTMEGPTYSLPPAHELQVEHILPQSRPKALDHIAEDDYSELVSHVGNLTLVLAEDNIALGNKLPKDKAAVYAEYGKSGNKRLELTAAVGTISDWSATDILDRAKELAEVAEKAWPIP